MSNIYNHQRFPPPKIGAKLQLLRLAENLTLDELSEKSGVSTAILSQIERNKSNPTLSTLWKITQTLDHPLENLLGTNEPANTVDKINNNTTPVIFSEDGGFQIRILGIVSILESVQWYDFKAQPGSSLISESHGKNSTESVTLMKGKLEILIEKKSEVIEAGETLRFSSDVKHQLKNIGKGVCQGFMVNLFSPVF